MARGGRRFKKSARRARLDPARRLGTREAWRHYNRGMGDFERAGKCDRCEREFVVSGTSANPGNETQLNVALSCECGGTLAIMLPGSTNRDLVRIEPKLS